MKKRFEIMNSPTKDIIRFSTIWCPKCKYVFGVDNRFIEKFGDVNFHYVCPYCKHESGLQKE